MEAYSPTRQRQINNVLALKLFKLISAWLQHAKITLLTLPLIKVVWIIGPVGVWEVQMTTLFFLQTKSLPKRFLCLAFGHLSVDKRWTQSKKSLKLVILNSKWNHSDRLRTENVCATPSKFFQSDGRW